MLTDARIMMPVCAFNLLSLGCQRAQNSCWFDQFTLRNIISISTSTCTTISISTYIYERERERDDSHVSPQAVGSCSCSRLLNKWDWNTITIRVCTYWHHSSPQYGFFQSKANSLDFHNQHMLQRKRIMQKKILFIWEGQPLLYSKLELISCNSFTLGQEFWDIYTRFKC